MRGRGGGPANGGSRRAGGEERRLARASIVVRRARSRPCLAPIVEAGRKAETATAAGRRCRPEGTSAAPYPPPPAPDLPAACAGWTSGIGKEGATSPATPPPSLVPFSPLRRHHPRHPSPSLLVPPLLHRPSPGSGEQRMRRAVRRGGRRARDPPRSPSWSSARAGEEGERPAHAPSCVRRVRRRVPAAPPHANRVPSACVLLASVVPMAWEG